jgi:hypothetical protein
LLLFINDQKVTPQREANTSKLWKSAGLKLIFTLLQLPELINEPYRTIANHTELSLGGIGPLIQELVKEKYFKQYNDKYVLENRDALLKRWIETFHTILRPKLYQGKFRFATPQVRENWKNVHLEKMYWGGEPAGAILTNFLQPEQFTLYTDLPKTEVIKQLRLVPAQDGEVELLKPFWNIDNDIQRTVPPLLAYAELSASLDSRNQATAERIKEKYNV